MSARKLWVLLCIPAFCAIPRNQSVVVELREKLDEVNALIAARGGEVDQDTLDKVEGLERQLEALELQHVELALNASRVPACMVMSAKRQGGLRNAGVKAALRGLAEDTLPVAEAAKMDLYRMIAVCIASVSVKDLEDFRDGKLLHLPDAYAEQAAGLEGEAQVAELFVEDWKYLSQLAAHFLQPPPGSGLFGRFESLLFLMFLIVPAVNLFRFLRMWYHERSQRKQEAKAPKKGGRKDAKDEQEAKDPKKVEASDAKNAQVDKKRQ